MNAPDRARNDLQRRKRGFTLIELLVVIMLLGIMISIGMLSTNLIGDDRGLKTQIVRLSSIVDIASDEAQMQGRDYGLEFMLGGYRFVEYDPFLEVWNEVIGDDLLQAKSIDEGMEFELELEDRRIQLQAQAQETEQEEDADDRDLTDDYLPHVLIMSSGDISPFRIKIVRYSDNATAGLKMEPGGTLELISDDEEL